MPKSPLNPGLPARLLRPAVSDLQEWLDSFVAAEGNRGGNSDPVDDIRVNRRRISTHALYVKSIQIYRTYSANYIEMCGDKTLLRDVPYNGALGFGDAANSDAWRGRRLARIDTEMDTAAFYCSFSSDLSVR